MAQMVQDPVYQQLAHELPHLLRSLRANVSVTIGVNLDEQFRPVAATLLSVNAQKYTSSTFLNRLLGSSGAGDPCVGVCRHGTDIMREQNATFLDYPFQYSRV